MGSQPDDYFANLLLGIDLLRTNKSAEAIRILETAACVNPDEDTPEEYLGEARNSRTSPTSRHSLSIICEERREAGQRMWPSVIKKHSCFLSGLN